MRGDIADPAVVEPLVAEADAVVNFAAESHVDRSILDPEAFLATGVIGVHVLLEACRTAPDEPRFLQVSTDEVYGSVDEGHATEDAPLAPRSPYAAAKAAGELLVRSYVITHGVDAVVTRGSNTYGPYHHPEKLIPLFITNAIDDRPLPLYGDGLQRRDWLYVSDHAGAIDFVLRHGVTGETYNVAGPTERTNRDVVALLLDQLGKPWSLVMQVEDRPGHDRRYAMDGAKLAGLGWQPRTTFEDGLAATVDWYTANEAWWRATRSGDWDGWYERQYGQRLRDRREAAAATPSRPPRTRRPATDARRRHGRRRPPRPSALVTGPRGRSLHRSRRADRLASATRSTSMHPTGSATASTATGPRSSSTPRRGPTSTAAPSIPSSRSGATRVATGVLAAACAERGTDLLIVSTNEVFAGEVADGRPWLPTDPDRARKPVRRIEAEGERLATPGVRRAARRGARDRPDGVAVRGSRARLPQPHPRCRRACPGRRRARSAPSATSGAPRPTPPTSPTRSSSCSPRTRSPGSTTSSTA